MKRSVKKNRRRLMDISRKIADFNKTHAVDFDEAIDDEMEVSIGQIMVRVKNKK